MKSQLKMLISLILAVCLLLSVWAIVPTTAIPLFRSSSSSVSTDDTADESTPTEPTEPPTTEFPATESPSTEPTEAPTTEPYSDGLPKNVLYLSNSLLKGFGKFGMSATDSTKDYYALLQNAFQWPKSERIVCKDFEVQLSVEGAVNWMNVAITPKLTDDMDLILIQLGDNVKDEHREIYRQTLPLLFDNLRTHCPNARIVYIGSWYKPINKPIYEQCCHDADIEYIDICDLFGVGSSYIGMHYFYDVSYAKTYNIYDYSDDEENKIITIYYKLGKQSYQDEIPYESYSIISQEQIRIIGREHVVDSFGVANHPSDFAFQRIAQRILYKLGYSDEDAVEVTSPTTQVPATVFAEEPTEPTFAQTLPHETTEPTEPSTAITSTPPTTTIQTTETGAPEEPTEKPIALGDINGDGIIDAKDRIILTRYLAKWKNYETIDGQTADINQDGAIDAKDRIALTRHLAKWKGYETLG